MTKHDLKISTGPFDMIDQGWKTHEIRKNDREFLVGDLLLLREWNEISENYTGKQLEVLVTYITKSPSWGLPKDLVVMSIRPFTKQPKVDSVYQTRAVMAAHQS